VERDDAAKQRTVRAPTRAAGSLAGEHPDAVGCQQQARASTSGSGRPLRPRRSRSARHASVQNIAIEIRRQLEKLIYLK
jgi:hypothetical protein